MNDQYCLEVQKINFSYSKKIPVLKDLNISFQGGKITALLGNNGSGKTTLLKILSGILSLQEGHLFFNHEEINKNNLFFYKKVIGFMPEFLKLYPNMQVWKALAYFSRLKGCCQRNVEEVLERVGLHHEAHKKVKALSKGLKQRLNLAQTIINSPKVVIFDEPSNGFDCSSVTTFYQILRDLADEGAVVILSNHQLTELFDNVDEIALLANGKINKVEKIDYFLAGEGIKKKQIWLYFDKPLTEEQFQTVHHHYPSFSLFDPKAIKGEIDKSKVGDIVMMTSHLGLKLVNLRVAGRELERLLESVL